jgi:hypothetical protein
MHQSVNCIIIPQYTNWQILQYHRQIRQTICRLVHLPIHQLRNLSIPRVWNLPSMQSIGCECVDWGFVNLWSGNLLIAQSIDWIICQSMIDSLKCIYWQIPQYTDCVIGTFCTLQIDRLFNLYIVQLADSSVYRFTDSTLQELTNSSIYGFTDASIYKLYDYSTIQIRQCDQQIPHSTDNSFIDCIICESLNWQSLVCGICQEHNP